MPSWFERNLDFGVAAGRRGRDSRRNAIGMSLNERPPRGARQNDERDASLFQILLRGGETAPR
jgi:hypothetical protein